MKKYLFIFIALVLFSFGLQAAPAHAAVAFVASSTSGENSSAAATTTSITVSGTNPVLVIGTTLGVDGGPAATTTGVTFSLGGTAVKIASTTDGGEGYADVWCIANPPAGTGTVHANFSASLDNYIVAAVFSGADPSNPCPSANAVTTSTHASNTSSTLTATGLASGDASFGMVGLFLNGDVTSPYMKNKLIYENVGSASDAESGYSTSTASVKASWQSGSNSYKDFVVVRIQQPTSVAPTISNVTSTQATSTATITWTTSVGADSLVNYGTSSSYTASSTYSSSSVTSHSVNLTGLTPSTTYHYQVVSSDGFTATSSDQTFTTASSSGGGTGTLVAGSGNILVTDSSNNRVEELSATGTYEGQLGCASGSCTAGSGNGELNFPYLGITTDSKGNVWVADAGNNRIEEFSATGTYESQFGSYGTGAGQFVGIDGVAVDASGNIWVVDDSDRVEEFSASGTYEGQIGCAGSSDCAPGQGGNGQFRSPGSMSIDASGNIWVADSCNSRVQEFSATGTYESQFGSNGGGAGQFSTCGVNGVIVDSSGNVWVTDTGNNRVEKFSSTGTYEGQMGCSGSSACSTGSGNGQFNGPQGITIDASGNIWVSDFNNNRVEEFYNTGTYESQFGSSGSGSGEFNGPYGIASTNEGTGTLVAGSGNFLVGDYGNNRVQEFSATGTYVGQLGCSSGACSTSSGNGEFNFLGTPYEPIAIAIDSNSNIWVVDPANNRVEEFSATGTYVGQIGCSSGGCSTGSGNGEFNTPEAIAIDSSGNLWVADTDNNRVEEFSASGAYESQFATVDDGVLGLVFDSSGNLWLLNQSHQLIQEVSATGTVEFQFGSEGSSTGEWQNPAGFTFDSSGNIWVADWGNNRVEEFSATGTYERTVGAEGTGNGEFEAPVSVTFDSSGNFWVADAGRVQEFSATGTYEGQFGTPGGTGNGDLVYAGDVVITGSFSSGSTNISSSSTQHWAWNDETGWIDFYDTHNVFVSSTKITGYASSSIGDISLDCGTSPSGNICGTKSDYGVSNNGSGDLAGWAWNDGYGWISFCGNSSGGGSTLSGSSWICPSSPTYQVVINPTTGVFSGWAWNDTLGWISFNCSNTSNCGTSQYDVVTTWTLTGVAATGTLDSETFDTGVTSGGQLNSVTWEGSAPSSTAVGFQFAVASSSSGPWNFVGPDGTSATTYTGIAGVPISLTDYPVLAGRYFRYRVILSTNSSGSATPTVSGVQVNWSK